MRIARRSLIASGAGAAGASLLHAALGPFPALADETPPRVLPSGFPAQHPDEVREIVGVSHRDAEAVRRLVTARPALAKAAWDWGFGDWESALGAASHTGQREIAGILLAHGARPTLFSAAMLGQVDVVRAFVAASPGVQRTRGPHGLSLMTHALAGGDEAGDVAAFLEELGDADLPKPDVPRSPEDVQAVLGRYRFGPGDDELLEVYVDERGALRLRRGEMSARFLFGVEEPFAFYPTGADAVRIRFDASTRPARAVSVYDPDLLVTAVRI
jgi:hypothetical protein